MFLRKPRKRLSGVPGWPLQVCTGAAKVVVVVTVVMLGAAVTLIQ